MCAKWDEKNFRPQALCEAIESARIRQGSRPLSIRSRDSFPDVGFDSSDYELIQSVITSAIVPSVPLDPWQKQRLVGEAIFATASAGQITQRALIANVSKLENSFADSPTHRYRLFTPISVYNQGLPRKSSWGSVYFTFDVQPPHDVATSEPWKRLQRDKELGPIKSYGYMTLALKARSPDEAFARANDAFDTLRGIWNYHFNRSTISRWSSANRPVNEIVTGPFYILRGASEEDGRHTWYDYAFPSRLEPKRIPESEWVKARRSVQNVRERLLRHPFRQAAEEGIRRYVRALDASDLSAAYLKLWSVLEHLTVTQKESYEVTVRRAAFLFEDDGVEEQILQHLRMHRNKSVHEGENVAEAERLLYQLKRYVERLLWVYIFRGHLFDNQNQLAMFLNLPQSSTVIGSQIRETAYRLRLLNLALSFRKELEAKGHSTII